jgi:hypothetical protein
VYLHDFDQAHRTQKSFIGHLTRYADDFVIQCGTAEQAQRALGWAQTQMERLGLRLNVEKTRIVNDREAGFDFLGFHHHRVVWRKTGKECRGIQRWPSAKACRKFRERVRKVLGSTGQVRHRWGEVHRDLRSYLTGWCQYYRHGQSYSTFAKLDHWVEERVARNFARSQPRSKKHRPRRWPYYRHELAHRRLLPTLTGLARGSFPAYEGPAKVRWRAVLGRT